MSKKVSFDQQVADILVHQDKQLSSIQFPDADETDALIDRTKELLKRLNIDSADRASVPLTQQRTIQKRVTWDELWNTAVEDVGSGHDIRELFTEEEIQENRDIIRRLNNEFNEVYKLDALDITISAVGGIVGALVDILLVGIPAKTCDGLKAGPLSDYIRDYFDKRFPEEEMQKLANSKISKVPFDAQDNRNTKIRVDGLSSYYHRLLQLGHDPLLGFIFGVADILNGTMTTIDKNGKIVVQVMENYADRTESDIFAALSKQILHFKSDITTSMGLPVPLMSLFNLLQFGSIGEEELTIAEIVQGMYYEGYDFIHFCSMSVPVMITEVIVRLCYSLKRIHDGYSIKDSIPFSVDREKNPKLASMLFISQSVAVAINAGKVAFTKNPMAINYPQWLAFAKATYKELIWGVIQKPKMRDDYVSGKINEELKQVIADIDQGYDEFFSSRNIVIID